MGIFKPLAAGYNRCQELAKAEGSNLSLNSENIVSAVIKDKKAAIELKNIGGDSIDIECIRKCIVLTLGENFAVTSVEIIINGESKSINLPIAPNEL